jgi:hypothetical protein
MAWTRGAWSWLGLGGRGPCVMWRLPARAHWLHLMRDDDAMLRRPVIWGHRPRTGSLVGAWPLAGGLDAARPG